MADDFGHMILMHLYIRLDFTQSFICLSDCRLAAWHCPGLVYLPLACSHLPAWHLSDWLVGWLVYLQLACLLVGCTLHGSGLACLAR